MEKPTRHLSDTDILPLIQAETVRLRAFQDHLAQSAIKGLVISPELKSATDELVVAATEVEHTLEGLTESLSPFGDEDSYKTVFRSFVVGENLGAERSVESLWPLLEQYYDMDEETIESVAETLEEWADDIQTDAAELGIRGIFTQHEGNFVFMVRASRQEKTEQPALTEVAITPELEASVVENIGHLEVIEQPNEPRLIDLIANQLHIAEGGTVAQPLLKKTLAKLTGRTADDLQAEIDALTAEGKLFKIPRGVKKEISLTPQDIETPEIEETLETEKPEQVLDIRMASDIITTLCKPGRHVQQEMTLNELWIEINDVVDKQINPFDSEIAELRATSRQLKSMGIVTAGAKKIGTGRGARANGVSTGSHRRRKSASMMVFKVGLVDQATKEDLKAKMQADQLHDYLRETFEAAQ